MDTCNFITQETEAGGSLQIQGQPSLRGDSRLVRAMAAAIKTCKQSKTNSSKYCPHPLASSAAGHGVGQL